MLIFCMSLALSFCHYPLCPPPSPPPPPSPSPSPPPPPQTSPASSLLPHTLSTLYLLPTQCSSSPGLQRGREKKKMFVSVFIFLLSLFFLHKMNKVNIFYYTEQKKVFFFTWLKIRDENCNKEKLLYVLFLFSVCRRDHSCSWWIYRYSLHLKKMSSS